MEALQVGVAKLVHCNGAIVKVVPIIFIKELNKKLILQTGSTNSLRT